MVAASNYRDGQTGGRGYIGLAAMIFGNWRPGGLLAGSGLFGYTQTLSLRQGATRSRRCCSPVAVLAVAAAVLQARRGSTCPAASWAAIGVLLGVMYFSVDSVPNDFSPDDALRHHAARPRVRLATTTNAGGRRADLSQGECG